MELFVITTLIIALYTASNSQWSGPSTNRNLIYALKIFN